MVARRVGPERIRDSLTGRAGRVKDNGLGFDQTRLGSQADETSIWIDPVVEVLAFFGLALLPVRGRGADRQLDRFADTRERQRGWPAFVERTWMSAGRRSAIACRRGSRPGLR